MGHRFSYPNKNYKSKYSEYKRNLSIFEEAINRNGRLYDIALTQKESLREDIKTVDEMGKYYCRKSHLRNLTNLNMKMKC